MSSAWLNDLSAWLSLHPGWLATALFTTAFIESLAIAGIIVPGVAILFAVAVLAGETGMPLAEALLWAGLGAIAGDTASFGLGRLLQGRLTTAWPLSRYPKIIGTGERFFKRHAITRKKRPAMPRSRRARTSLPGGVPGSTDRTSSTPSA